MKIAMKRPVMRKLDVKLPTKPTRFIAIVLLAVAILASIVYWILRLRGDDAPPPASVPITASAPPPASVALFGEHPDLLPSAANLGITGVIIAPEPQESIAIVVETGQRPRALRVGSPVSTGLRLTEVHSRYIVVSDGESSTRIALPERAAASASVEVPAAVEAPSPPTTPDGGLRGEPPHQNGDGEPPGTATTQ
jgi:general secretion pathway protein C